MPHQDKSHKCYLDLGINLEWPNQEHESNVSLLHGRIRYSSNTCSQFAALQIFT